VPLRAIGLAAGAALLWLGCAGPGAGPVVEPALAPRPGAPTATVGVVSHGWHTAIVFARADIPPASWPEQARFPPARFLEVGWGDRAFYETRDAGAWLAIKAALGSERSALHVVGFDRAPAAEFPGADLVVLELSAAGVDALARFVSATYARDAAGDPIEAGPGLAPVSRFYASTRRYSILYTCNSWVAEALRAAGCPTAAGWIVTADGLMAEARRCRSSLAPGALRSLG
jgi:uncharacterized protein (TIGR02117 family)